MARWVRTACLGNTWYQDAPLGTSQDSRGNGCGHHQQDDVSNHKAKMAQDETSFDELKFEGFTWPPDYFNLNPIEHIGMLPSARRQRAADPDKPTSAPQHSASGSASLSAPTDSRASLPATPKPLHLWLFLAPSRAQYNKPRRKRVGKSDRTMWIWYLLLGSGSGSRTAGKFSQSAQRN
ncbi:hypothetical protein CRENBAI_022010 [Crenichthys baileyi]|uniref:Uncharacterized protein n=1 Tax=Crenichthys baileyi TaxID=28760 RepID=A0AAV9RPX0_9TELE